MSAVASTFAGAGGRGWLCAAGVDGPGEVRVAAGEPVVSAPDNAATELPPGRVGLDSVNAHWRLPS